ncbi:MAG: beta galactosidase jelly roll domain-containing protein [Bacteroidota bacterium]
MKARQLLIWIIATAGLCAAQTAQGQERWDRVLSLSGKWKFSIGDRAMWAERYYNDSNWEEVYVPAKWEEEGFNGYDGYAWYRTSFSGASLNSAEGSYSLILGYIDDVDEVYLNGKKIGASGGFPPHYHTAYNALRTYHLPKEFIDFKGRNVIAVRVFDEGLEGGIVSGDVGIYTNRTDKGLAVSLRGMWNFRITGRRNTRIAVQEKDVAELMQGSKEGWEKISVPGAWEKQGFHDYDGTAWYHKEFLVPKELATEDLVLLLGKIDDSDRTFVNGRFVGAMTDQWLQLRAYPIPAGTLKPGAVNNVVIFVDDPQGFGGIYEGPVGLMKQTEFTRYMRWRD